MLSHTIICSALAIGAMSAAQDQAPPLSVVSVERAQFYQLLSGRILESSGDDVVLIAGVKGLNKDDLNLDIREYYLTVPGKSDRRYKCEVVGDIMAPEDTARVRWLAFVVGNANTKYDLHIGKRRPASIVATKPVQRLIVQKAN
jgi:hypothetical protein